MRKRLLASLILASAALAAPALAQSPKPSVTHLPGFVFGYSGTACPGGSELYKGPEQKLAAASNAVYCVFTPKVAVIDKNTSKTCPFGMKETAEKPTASDVLWCEPDANAKPFTPPPLPVIAPSKPAAAQEAPKSIEPAKAKPAEPVKTESKPKPAAPAE